MRQSLNAHWSEAALTRLLTALEQELLAASDEEILAAAKELRMNPAMKGSAAFLGLRCMLHRTPESLLDGFDPALLERLGVRTGDHGAVARADLHGTDRRVSAAPRRPRAPRRTIDKKNPRED